MTLDKRKFWIPVVIGLILGGLTTAITPWGALDHFSDPLLLLGRAVLFGPAILVAVLCQSDKVLPVLCIGQFPIYGLLLGWLRNHWTKWLVILTLIILHGLFILYVIMFVLFLVGPG